ncbi:reverse transcriptase domain-containing protein [Tanacetum coccineum]
MNINNNNYSNLYTRNTQPHSFILSYKVRYGEDDVKYIRLVEDDNNFKVQKQEFAPSVVSPLIKHLSATRFVGACHGLVCLYCFMKNMLVIWNPSTRKSFGIADPNHLNARGYNIYGFGVCPDTSDSTVPKIIQTHNKPWHVEVFTLSSGVWNVIRSSNLVCQSIKLTSSPHVVIDTFIYWVACEKTLAYHDKYMVVSFDLITKEFKPVHLPDSLTYNQRVPVSLCKLRESLVVCGSTDRAEFCDVWIKQHDSSFKKLFSIHAWVIKYWGLQRGEPIFETEKEIERLLTTLDVYDSSSQQINNLGIYGVKGTFVMGSYKESPLLLDHLDSHALLLVMTYSSTPQPFPRPPVRNTGGRSGPQGLKEPTKKQQDKLNAVKARLLYDDESGRNPRNHEESHYSESKTPTARTEPRRRHGSKHSRSPSPIASVFRRLRRNRPPSPGPRPRKEGGVFNRLEGKEQSASARSDSRHQSSQVKGTKVQPRKHHYRGTSPRGNSRYSESEDSEGGHWKSKSKRHRSNTYEDDLSQPWTCEERNLRHFDFPRTRMPSHVKTYDGSGDPEDHLKLFQSAVKTERWAMPTWCHMFNSTLTGNARVWFDKLLKESIDNYEDLKAAFRENYLQQTKHINDSVEIHHIKQRDGESTEDFIERYKAEVLDVKGAPECMKISGFMHGITRP